MLYGDYVIIQSAAVRRAISLRGDTMRCFTSSCLILLAVVTTTAQADFILWNDEQLTVDSEHQEGNLYDTSSADIVSGGGG